MFYFKEKLINWRRRIQQRYEELILSLLEKNSSARFLDCGCDDGSLTMRFAEKIGAKEIFGIEINEEQRKKSFKKGIQALRGDLNKNFDFPDNYFDVICSNQVIEHLYDTDNFLAESMRVLKKGGYIVCCTENLSSWHNILALILGWQPFSINNISSMYAEIGNPFSLHYKEPFLFSAPKNIHIKGFAYRGLKEIFEIHGFKIENLIGSGYYPIPIEKIDPRHAAFLIIKARKID
ncbi:MAG: hypothetical protein A2174_02315 [Candidatus Portnoybacteria bacterium RBG_13_41_18]|uniref:Uncharacterized protein n=1 Tax=Candidatus Portnoybacteria bacterium RBG_13_41_18 TaxID=1801991 RepID=A0A1G2F9K2_9BACT|nr:MAG: hypothetical protein A2174_02315 [Candidatus Portnoybacteria bacterium RBG_13_41_18]